MCAFKKHRRLRELIFHAAGAETTSVDRKSFMATKKTLTEQELLAMSDKDYMNDKQLEFFRNRLTEMEAELRHNAGQTTENLRESTVVPDPADRATIEEEHALELRTRASFSRRCRRPSSALTKANTAIAKKPANRSACAVFWPARRLRFLWKHRNAARLSRRCSATDTSTSGAVFWRPGPRKFSGLSPCAIFF